MMRYANVDRTMIVSDAGACIPVDEDNSEYIKLIEDGAVIQDYVALPPSIIDVANEAQRRIIALVGARDIDHCFAKQFNAQMRALEITRKEMRQEVLTPAEVAEAALIEAMVTAIKRIRECSNRLTDPVPQDYRDDRHW